MNSALLIRRDDPPLVELKLAEAPSRRRRVRTSTVQFDSESRRLFTADEYHRMEEAGILDEDERVELLEGEIVLMSPIGHRHFGSVNRLNRVLGGALGSNVLLGIQNPFRAEKISEPRPDVLVMKPRDDDYSKSIPTPTDVYFIIEVAESSLSRDRNRKLAMYARIGIQEYWIVNLIDETLEVYRVPKVSGYFMKKIYTWNMSVAPLAFPKIKIAVKDLLIPA